MSKVYSEALVNELLHTIESLALRDESNTRQINKVDELLIGTKYNWKGGAAGGSRVQALKQMLEDATK